MHGLRTCQLVKHAQFDSDFRRRRLTLVSLKMTWYGAVTIANVEIR